MNRDLPDLKNRDIVMISDYVDDYDEEDINEEQKFLEAIKKQIEKDGKKFYFIEIKNLEELDKELNKFDPKDVIIFNWCEEIYGKPNSGPQITKYLDKKGFIYTGADTQTLELNQNKIKVKDLLIKNGVSTPKYFLAKINEPVKVHDGITFPLIVKTSKEHGSLGITDKSVVTNYDELVEQVNIVFKDFKQDAMVEKFIDGPEYHVTVWGNGEPQVLPLIEIDYTKSQGKKFKLQNYDSKWTKGSRDYEVTKIKKPEGLTDYITKEIEQLALATFKITKCRGYARFEIRVQNNIPYIIDVNANPAFLPHVSVLKSAKLAGYNNGRAVEKICEFSLISK